LSNKLEIGYLNYLEGFLVGKPRPESCL